MKISEVSDLTGVSPDMIRHYEKLGLIQPKRLENGYRSFALKDSFHIILIRQFNSLGISLKNLRQFDKKNFEKQYQELKAKQRELQEEERWLKSKIANAQDFVKIYADTTKNKKHSVIRFKNLYYYTHPLSLSGFANKAPQILENLGAFRYCFRIRKENLERKFPNDIGFISQVRIEDVDTDMTIYSNISIFRTYGYWDTQDENEEAQMTSKNLKEYISRIEKAGYRIIGDCFITQLTSGNDRDGDYLCLDFIVEKAAH